MKMVNNNPLQEMRLDVLLKEIRNVAKGTYSLYVDLRNGNVNIAKSAKPKKYEYVIGKVSLEDDSKKIFLKDFFRNVRRVIKEYQYSGALICKTAAIKQYGIEYISKFDEVLVVKNPYNPSGYPVCLYDINVLNYNNGR